MLAVHYQEICTFLFNRFPKLPLLVVGPTGCGKTDVPERLYATWRKKYEDAVNAPEADRTQEQKDEVAKGPVGFAYLNFTACEFADLVGLPFRDGDKTVYCPPSWLKDIENYPRGVAVFDEVNRVELQTRQAYMQILDRRAIGNVKIPAGWIIVQTANPADDSYQVSEFDKALVRRSSATQLDFDLQTWQDFGMREYKSSITGGHMNSRVLAVATRLANRGLTQKVDNPIRPIPTAAGLTICGEMLDAGADTLSHDSRITLLAGLIGSEAATLLEASLRDDRLKGLLEKALRGDPIKGENVETMTDLMFLFYDTIAKSPAKFGAAACSLFHSLHDDIKPVYAKACYVWFSKHKKEFAEFKKVWGEWALENMYVMQAILEDEDEKPKK
jgi:MoxR-like ATPase